jgi:hypothetical protein
MTSLIEENFVARSDVLPNFLVTLRYHPLSSYGSRMWKGEDDKLAQHAGKVGS